MGREKERGEEERERKGSKGNRKAGGREEQEREGEVAGLSNILA